MDRPQAIPPQADGIPCSLREIPQWVCWKHHFNQTRGAWTKLPINPLTGKAARTSDPSTWATFDAALTAYEFEDDYSGIGFVFTKELGLVGIDIDKCVDEHGGLSDLAKELLDTLPGYSELSVSGTGLHIITRADLPRAYADHKLGLEMYNTGRYFTITGVPHA